MGDNCPLWYGELRVSRGEDTEKAKCAGRTVEIEMLTFL